MAHWRALFSSAHYLTAADLYDERTDSFREVTVQIERVNRVTMTGEKGREDSRPGVYFVGHKKPLGANATNCDTISLVVGSDDMKRWPGKRITLFVGETQIRQGTRTIKRPCVRVKPSAPPEDRPRSAPTLPTNPPDREDPRRG